MIIGGDQKLDYQLVWVHLDVHQQYILLFGGMTEAMQQTRDCDDIWIYSYYQTLIHHIKIAVNFKWSWPFQII